MQVLDALEDAQSRNSSFLGGFLPLLGLRLPQGALDLGERQATVGLLLLLPELLDVQALMVDGLLQQLDLLRIHGASRVEVFG